MKRFFLGLFYLLIFLTFTNCTFALDKTSPFVYEEIVRGYSLPYPGILPDNRFYFLKMTRDKIVGMLISDPLKKAEFDILQADKRLASAIFLLLPDKKNNDLAISTISKGENYLFDAAAKIKQAKQQGIGTVDKEAKLSDSLKKHQEILKRLKAKFSGNLREKIQQQEKRTETLRKMY